MNIRLATVWDAIGIVDMWKDMINETPVISNGDAESFYLVLLNHIKSHPKSTVLVAEDDSGLIGFTVGYIAQYDYNPQIVGFCELIYIKPDKRNLNGFSQLYDELCKIALENGAVQLRLLSSYSEKKHWDFLGFTPFQTIYIKNMEVI